MPCNIPSEKWIDYQEQALNPHEQEQMAKHLETCVSCQAEQAAWAKLIGDIQQVPVADPGEAFWHNFSLRVQRAIASEQKATHRAKQPFATTAWRFPFSWPSFPMGAAMACAALAAVTVGLTFFLQPRDLPTSAPMSLQQVVHQANLSHPEEIDILMDVMVDDGDDMTEEDLVTNL